ncbi:MAG: thioredoxin-disulfide reductase [Omnitrophica bacterium]|nr:thioredoxin-disulfide reductase [Candidatus Omnitrophota bacterium]
MIYDAIIIGGGPAGLTAAIYTSRARLKTLLVESFTVPAQAAITSDIENYPGFPEGLNGFELVEKFKKQAKKFGTEFKTGDVTKIKEHKEAGLRAYRVDFGDEKISSLSVIIATGARPKQLGIAGEDTFRGKGVSYCAVCDGAFFKGKNIVVIGGGDTALEEAVFLTKFANKVSIIHRRDRLRATKILQERAFANKKIEFILESTAEGISGDSKVKAVKIKNTKSGKETELPCEGVFLFVGYIPNTDFLKGTVGLDKDGYVKSGHGLTTSARGIFVCGDARAKRLRQIVTAAGDGAVAAFSARLYVEELKGTAYE